MKTKFLPSLKMTANLLALRNLVQTSFAFFCLYVGYRFNLYYLWISGQSENIAIRPPSVEAFLPISALMAAKKLLMTGIYDPIHPAGLTIFLAAIIISILLRKSFCGWVCPVGFVSNLSEKLAGKMNTLVKLPKWFNWAGQSLKYLLLAFFLYFIGYKMSLQIVNSFMLSTYNITADARMLSFFLHPTGKTIIIFSALIFLSFLIKNIWCRFLCPYGAFLGLFSIISPLKISRDETLCINCNKCNKTCPACITVSSKTKVSSPECIGCLECVAICPADNCLSTTYFNKNISPFVIPVLTILIIVLFWAAANFTGHWHQTVNDHILKKHYMTINENK